MNPMAAIGLLFDGVQILSKNIKILSVLSADVVGIGVLLFAVISVSPSGSEWDRHRLALLSTGACGFVLVSCGIVAVSRVWHSALAELSTGLLILSVFAAIAGVVSLIKKKDFPVDPVPLFSRLPVLRRSSL